MGPVLMVAGKLDKRIDIQAETKVGDGMGGYTVTFETVASNVACAIWPVSGKEQIQSMQNVGIITHRIRLRYRSVLRSSWRVSWAGRYFAIVSIIDPNMEHRWLDLMCKEAA